MMKKFLIVLAMVVTASLIMGAGCLVNTAPVITTTALPDATVGTAYTATVEATDANGDALTFSVSGPTDMVISEAGVISGWTPTESGIENVTVAVTDGKDPVSANFIITVSAVEPEPVLELTGIVVDPKTMTLFAGGSEAIESVTATFEIRGHEIFIVLGECTFVSSDIEVATVSDVGLVEAVAEGVATVTVSYEGETDTVEVTVNPVLLDSIVVLPETMTLLVGESETISLVTADYSDGSTAVIVLVDCTYLSDDEEVATVLAGVVTAVAAGEATITVSYENESDTIAVTVSEPEPEPEIELTRIVVLPETMTLFEGESEAIQSVTATYAIKTGTEVPIALGDCDFVSDDKTIATVSDAGLVSAVAKGVATITVSYEGETDTVEVTVIEFVLKLVGIEVDPEEMTLCVPNGVESEVTTKTFKVTANYNNDDTEDVTSDCVYGIDNTSVATVEIGEVTALKVGTATISISYTEGSITKTDAIEVTVGDRVAMEIIADDLLTCTADLEKKFTAGLVANDDVGRSALVYFTLPEGTKFNYYIGEEIDWDCEVDSTGEVVFGLPTTGTPLSDAIYDFGVIFYEAGTYPTLVEVWEVVPGTPPLEKVELLSFKVITVVVEPSNVATLSDLTVDIADSIWTPPFASDEYTYDVSLPFGTTDIPIVEATLTDVNASREITQAETVGGTAYVVVTAEDGFTEETYEITFTVATISSLASFTPLTFTQTGTIAGTDVQYATGAAVIAALPTTVAVTLVNAFVVNVPVTWADTDTYDAATAADYTFTATWGAMPAGANNDNNLAVPTVEVTVAP